MSDGARISTVIVRRWLVALSLASTAEDLAARLSPTTAALALVGADTAAEAVLGILADESGEIQKRGDQYDQMVTRAAAAAAKAGVTFDPGLARAARLTHQRRNSIVHHGGDAQLHDVEEARVVVRSLLEVLGAALPALGAVPPGAGPLRAVASLIDAPELVERMTSAEARLDAGDLAGSREDAAIALAMALIRTSPPLRPAERWSAYRSRTASSNTSRAGPGLPTTPDRELEDAIERIGKRFRLMSNWLRPIALGLDPADLARLEAALGHAWELMNGHWTVDAGREPVSETELRWALPTLARVVFRLWEMRALVEGREVDAHMRAARDLADPF